LPSNPIINTRETPGLYEENRETIALHGLKSTSFEVFFAIIFPPWHAVCMGLRIRSTAVELTIVLWRQK